MTQDLSRPDRSAGRRTSRLFLAIALPLLAGVVLYIIGKRPFQERVHAAPPFEALTPVQAPADEPAAPGERGREQHVRAPDLTGGVDWLNTAGPIRLRDLKGKIVLLDFWTLCCINCIHTLPDLAKLEKKYANQLVVIGVHSAKFDNERNSASIKKAILRYEITHPVVNDANMRIWRAYAVNSWPTLWLIDPEGYLVGRGAGEGLYEAVDRLIGQLVAKHRADKTLDESPLHFDLARHRERGDRPLFFPGKVLADAAGGRLFIADSTHHRIVITDLTGKKIAIAGTGKPGRADGPFETAGFNDPQGMALKGDVLYVADRKNDLIRALDLKTQRVRTIAGTGQQGQDRSRGGSALKVALNSPWDLYLHGDQLFIAMAGHHQIWTLDLKQEMVAPFAGSGREEIRDGPAEEACFAQPSGLTGDGTTLYVADSEVSAVRAVPLNGGEVTTLVGQGLFEFGDHDGAGPNVRLQHALGVAWHGGKVFVADTYNSKIKLLDPKTQACSTYLGGKTPGWLTGGLFNEPGGLSIAGDKMYVADTNNHRIRVVDLKTRALSTLALQGVEAPAATDEGTELPSRPASYARHAPASIRASEDLALEVHLALASDGQLDPETPIQYTVETVSNGKVAWSEPGAPAKSEPTFHVTVPGARLAGANSVRLSVVFAECKQTSRGLGRVRTQAWEVPLRAGARTDGHSIQLSGSVVEENSGKN
jgi:thiol-disulfide isomerase/thioredoxin